MTDVVVKILPSSHSSHNEGGRQRTWLGKNTHDAVAAERQPCKSSPQLGQSGQIQLQIEKLSRKYAKPIHVFQSNKSRESEPHTFGNLLGVNQI